MIATIIGLVRTYKYVVMLAVAASVIGAGYVHVRNDGLRDARLTAADALLVERTDALNAAASAHAVLNDRIRESNRQKIEQIERADVRTDRAELAAAAVRVQNDEMLTEIGALRFEILQGIQNDEDFADWAYDTVPLDAWGLLRAASEATATDP